MDGMDSILLRFTRCLCRIAFVVSFSFFLQLTLDSIFLYTSFLFFRGTSVSALLYSPLLYSFPFPFLFYFFFFFLSFFFLSFPFPFSFLFIFFLSTSPVSSRLVSSPLLSFFPSCLILPDFTYRQCLSIRFDTYLIFPEIICSRTNKRINELTHSLETQAQIPLSLSSLYSLSLY